MFNKRPQLDRSKKQGDNLNTTSWSIKIPKKNGNDNSKKSKDQAYELRRKSNILGPEESKVSPT